MLFGCDIVVEKQTPVSLEISERMFDKTEEYFQRNRKDIDEEEITSEMQGNQENSDAIRFMKASKRR